MGMDARGFIYGLTDPRTGLLRYVGQTAKTPEQRLNGHLGDRHGHTPKSKWISELRAAKLKPGVVIMAEVSADDLNVEEIALIAGMRAAGAVLFNISPGGGLYVRPPLPSRPPAELNPDWEIDDLLIAGLVQEAVDNADANRARQAAGWGTLQDPSWETFRSIKPAYTMNTKRRKKVRAKRWQRWNRLTLDRIENDADRTMERQREARTRQDVDAHRYAVREEG